MKKKHTYQSVDVEAIDVAAFVAMIVAACVVPRTLAPVVCIVALDVAKVGFYAALSDARGKVAQILRFEHPRQTLAMLRLLLELKKKELDVQIVLEPTGTYGDAIKHQCHRHGMTVHEVSPKRTHDMAEVLDGVPSMHDAKAAVVLAQLHAMGKSRQWAPHSTQRRDLRALVDRRVLYSDPLEQHYGRLEALMARYWPEFGGVIDVRTHRSWISLLSKYPGPEAVLNGAKDPAEVLRAASHGMLSPERVEEVIGAAVGSLGVPMRDADRALLGDLVGEIQRLRTKVDEIDQQIEGHVQSDPVMKVMAGAVGPAAAAALFTFVGPPAQYGSASAYAKACGLNLKVRSSGTHEGKLKITKRGPPRVRQLLYLAALRLCQSNTEVRAWYQQRESYKAKNKMKAVVAVMRKLIRALWAMGHTADNPQSFDSKKLFDARRLGLEPQPPNPVSHSSSTDVKAPTDSALPSGQTGKRTRRRPQRTRPSVAEVRP
jgi:transposase